jgi:tRNA(Ile)-lysidine synthase
LKAFQGLPLALQRRVLRAAAYTVGLRLEFRHVEDALNVCEGRKKSAPLPYGWSATRTDSDELRFGPQGEDVADYESVLTVPGVADIEALGVRVEAVLLSDPGGYPAEHLFDEALLNKELLVRNWRAGDRFWPAHTKAPKKIKELLQERQVTGAEKKLWPIVAHGQDVLWMRGFLRPAAWQCGPDARRAVLIREVALQGGTG